MGGGGLLLVRLDRRGLDQGEADVVEAFDEAVLAEGVDLELDDPAVGTADLLRRRDRSVSVAFAPRSASSMQLGEILGARP